jgi:hypothetical protein
MRPAREGNFREWCASLRNLMIQGNPTCYKDHVRENTYCLTVHKQRPLLGNKVYVKGGTETRTHCSMVTDMESVICL